MSNPIISKRELVKLSAYVLIFKYRKDVCTFPQQNSICWNLCNKIGSCDSGSMFLWSFVTIALHTTKVRFGEDKIVLSRNLHTRVNGFSPFPHVHGVFCAEKFIGTSEQLTILLWVSKREWEINISITVMVALSNFRSYESPMGSLSRLEAVTAVLCYPR